MNRARFRREERPFLILGNTLVQKRFSVLNKENLIFDLLWTLCKNNNLNEQKVRHQSVLDSNDRGR